jgi:hypothetical protein
VRISGVRISSSDTCATTIFSQIYGSDLRILASGERIVREGSR